MANSSKSLLGEVAYGATVDGSRRGRGTMGGGTPVGVVKVGRRIEDTNDGGGITPKGWIPVGMEVIEPKSGVCVTVTAPLQ